MKSRYYTYTWDSPKDAFTPQKGVRCGPYSQFGLRRALRKLRELGYPADRGDPSVLVEKAPMKSKREANHAVCAAV